MSNFRKAYLSQNHFSAWMESPEMMRNLCLKRDKSQNLTEHQKRDIEFGHKMHNKAKLLYPNGIEPTDSRTIETYQSQSLALLKSRIPLFEPQFQYDRLFARPDILVPADDGSWELIEVKSNKTVHDNSVKYTAFLYYICIKAGVKIDWCAIMHLKGYIDDGTPLEKIFDKTDVTERVLKLQGEIVESINQMREI